MRLHKYSIGTKENSRGEGLHNISKRGKAHLGVQAKESQRAMARRDKSRTLLEGDALGATSEEKQTKETVVWEHEERLKVQGGLL